MGRFKKGMLLGGLLGAGFVWLNTTKKGRAMRDQVLDHAATIFAELKDTVQDSKQWKDITKTKYAKLVREAVEEYSTKKKLPDNVKNMITKLVMGQWKNFKK